MFRIADTLIVALLVAVLAMGVTGCEKTGETAQAAGGEGGIELLEGTTANFDELVLKSEVPVLLDFTATWCPPCRSLHPNLEQVAKVYPDTVRVVQVDVDKNRELAQRYKIRSIPALFVIKDGKTVEQEVGYKSVHDLKQMLGPHL